MATGENKKALVLCSGGMDSTTLLALAVERFGAENVHALSVSYGQRHIRELDSARAVAAYYGVRLHETNLADVFVESSSSLLAASNEPVPEKSYFEQIEEGHSPLVSTYVPFRNGLFLSSAASVALSCGCSVVMYGAHRDDWARDAYPDCSHEFVFTMGEAIRLGTGGTLELEAPFVDMTKADIVAIGLEHNVPYDLTWSCYEGGDAPCGHCATCIDRAEAFAKNNAPDPLLAK